MHFWWEMKVLRYFDLHCDTLEKCFEQNQGLKKNDFALDTQRLSKFDRAVQVFACFIDDKFKGEQAVKRFYDLFEVYKNVDFKKVEAILSIENLNCLNGKIENLVDFARLGVKICSLVWNSKNEVASGVLAQGGLTEFGLEVVRTCEELDIVIDVSHLNETGFFELEKIATKPFIATHSNSFSVCDNKRNLSDEQFACIRDRGGLVGLNLYPVFVGKKKRGYKDLIKHVEHFLNLGGHNILALGTDFDGAKMDERFKSIEQMTDLYLSFCDYFSKETADAIFFGNASKFFKIL